MFIFMYIHKQPPEDEINAQLYSITASLVVETNGESTTYLSKVWRALTKSSEIWKTLYSGIVVQVLQQIQGLKTILYNLPKVLKR